MVEKLVEWRLAGETEVLGENLPQRHFVHHKSHMTSPGFVPGPPREWSLAGETEVLGENLPQGRFVHHKSHMTRPGFEPGPPRWEASD
jgi:hypothetical protein